jgi:hypothetical protein
MKVSLFVALALTACGCAVDAGQNPTQSADVRVNDDARVLQDFQARIAKYLEVRKQPEKDAPPLKETSDPAKIKAAQDGLASRIRAARASAQPGDIFTPAIREKFRRLLYPELKGEDGRDARKVMKGHDAPPAVPIKVNAKYPDSAPRPTVPANFLANLPKLPEELEYRIIDKHLILLDTEAALIVDYIPNAIR